MGVVFLIQNFDQLSTDTLEKIKGFGIKAHKNFRRSCRLLKAYLEENGLEFSIESGEKWLLELYPYTPPTKSQYVLYAARRRTVLLLSECQEGKLDTWRIYPKKKALRPESAEYLKLIECHAEKLHANGLAKNTVNLAKCVVSSFLIYLEESGKYILSEVMPQDVTGYFASDKLSERKPEGIKSYAYRLKSFLSFLEDIGAVAEKKLSLSVPKVFGKQESIIKVLSEKAVNSIRNGDIKSDKGAAVRNHTMILLGLRLGIRQSDIVEMKLTDIDWRNDIVSFIQKKTQVPITLPLLPDVGNSLMEYILEFRPKVSDDKIFLRHYAPFQALSPRCMNTIAGYYLSAFKLEDCPQYGAHILRRTFATGMLRNNIPRSIISASIGQIDLNSVDVYLSADEERMRKCALDLKGIECVRWDLT